MDTTSRNIQNVKATVTKQMSQLDAQARTTLADLKSKSQSRASPVFDKANQHGRRLWGQYLDFTNDSPAVSAFLTIQLLLAAIPLAIYASFVVGTIVTLTLIAATVAGTIIFFAGCVLASVLFVTSTIGAGLFLWIASVYLFFHWFQSVQRLGLSEGSRKFLFGVERQVKHEVDEVKVYALRAEDKVSEQNKLEDVVPGLNNAA